MTLNQKEGNEDDQIKFTSRILRKFPGRGRDYDGRGRVQGAPAPKIQGFEDSGSKTADDRVWRPVSDRKIKMGIVGFGVCQFGTAFSFQDHPNVEVVAVSDLFPDRCKNLARACRCSKTYPSLEEMLAKDREDTGMSAGKGNNAMKNLGRRDLMKLAGFGSLSLCASDLSSTGKAAAEEEPTGNTRKTRWEDMLPHEFLEARDNLPVCYMAYGLAEPHGAYNALGLDWLKAYPCIGAKNRVNIASQAHLMYILVSLFVNFQCSGYDIGIAVI